MNIRQLCRPSSLKPMLLALVATFSLTAVLATGRPAQAETKPIAIVAFNSINSLLEDANFIGSLAEQPRLADSVRPFVGMLQGLDNDKPIGLLVQSDGITPSGAICIPVTDLEMLLGGLQMFGVTSEDGPNGTTEIGVSGQTLYTREANGWAFISMTPQMLENVPANPGELLGKLIADYDIGVRVYVQNIPEEYKQMALSQLQEGMANGLQKSDDESDSDFAKRQQITELQLEQIKKAVAELDEVTFGIGVDSKQQRVYLDFAYSALVDSDLAEQLNYNSDPKTDFAGFYQPDAAMMLSFASKIPESEIAKIEQGREVMLMQMETAFDKETNGKLDDEDRAAVKSIATDFFDAFISSLKAGKMDGGSVLNVSPSSFSFVAGGFIADTTKIESGLKKLEAFAKSKDPNTPGIDWNSNTHAGVQFSTLSIPVPDDEEEAQQLFGTSIDIAIGLGKDSAYISVGRDCLEAAKSIIDASAASPQKSIPPVEITFALTQIMDTVAAFADEDDKAQILMIANMLANEANGRDHVRMIAKPIANGIRMRFEAEEGALRAIGAAAMQARMQAMQPADAGGF